MTTVFAAKDISLRRLLGGWRDVRDAIRALCRDFEAESRYGKDRAS